MILEGFGLSSNLCCHLCLVCDYLFCQFSQIHSGAVLVPVVKAFIRDPNNSGGPEHRVKSNPTLTSLQGCAEHGGMLRLGSKKWVSVFDQASGRCSLLAEQKAKG